MKAKCPQCQFEFPIKGDVQVKGGRARAAKWTREQRSKAMKKSWKLRKAKMGKSP